MALAGTGVNVLYHNGDDGAECYQIGHGLAIDGVLTGTHRQRRLLSWRVPVLARSASCR